MTLSKFELDEIIHKDCPLANREFRYETEWLLQCPPSGASSLTLQALRFEIQGEEECGRFLRKHGFPQREKEEHLESQSLPRPVS